jgi:homoserine kinase
MRSVAPITVRVPASTSNLGPAFDGAGLALELELVVHAEASEDGSFVVENEGEGAAQLPSDGTHRIVAAAVRAMREDGFEPPGVRLRVTNEIPIERGLGASAAATVAGLALAYALTRRELDIRAMIDRATAAEGHPDNVTPSVLGGLVCMARDGDRVSYVPVRLADGLKLALCIPDAPLRTDEARRILPKEVPFADAVFNVSRAATLVAALSSGDWEALAAATSDRLHQEHRITLMPELRGVLSRAREAGAFGAFVSGAGSTVAAFCTPDSAGAVAEEMAEAARSSGLAARARVCGVENRGVEVQRA